MSPKKRRRVIYFTAYQVTRKQVKQHWKKAMGLDEFAN